MAGYVLKRIALMIPTLLGISLISFFIIHLAPGGPVEQAISRLCFGAARIDANGAGVSGEVLVALKAQYGFDKPVVERYLNWLQSLLRFDFGTSFTFAQPVREVLLERLPVSLQFGVAALLLIYLLSVPLGIAKAVRSGSAFDLWSTILLLVAYSVPPLILAILLRVFFASGSFLDLFPLGELYSDTYLDKDLLGRVLDRAHHFVLPLLCYVAGGFAVTTFLTKNSVLEEMGREYARTARAKGLAEQTVIYKHILRNSLIPIVTALASFLPLFLGGSILIEQVFNIDGMGLLSYSALRSRDYNVIMALIFLQSLLCVIGRLLADVAYAFLDPRIDFHDEAL